MCYTVILQVLKLIIIGCRISVRPQVFYFGESVTNADDIEIQIRFETICDKTITFSVNIGRDEYNSSEWFAYVPQTIEDPNNQQHALYVVKTSLPAGFRYFFDAKSDDSISPRLSSSAFSFSIQHPKFTPLRYMILFRHLFKNSRVAIFDDYQDPTSTKKVIKNLRVYQKAEMAIYLGDHPNMAKFLELNTDGDEQIPLSYSHSGSSPQIHTD